ncbi:MAG: type II toxin-antitoxin system RelE/ParE family toxin [Oscillospiraceae bacterium]|nr:type II toxin-antitoxin system RelE/ParE family toxin [Oscillospiraceae bacterium]
MGFRVDYSPKARMDFLGTLEYISDDLSSPKAAERFNENLTKKEIFISENPFMYPLSRDEKLRAAGYRCAVVGNYSMLYLVDEEKSKVTIARIIYGARDLTAIDI